MATTTRRMSTEEDLLRTPEDGRKYELVDGQIRVTPAGFRHGRVAVSLTVALGSHVKEHDLGYVVDSSTGFRLPGGNVRLPDLAFVAKQRIVGELPEGFSSIPPDLAVEVLSPHDNARQVLDKVGEYLAAGVRLVWVIDPAARRATIYRTLSEVRTIVDGECLEGDDVVPGFRCPLSDVL
jgi:Uma2 family endonuclease